MAPGSLNGASLVLIKKAGGAPIVLVVSAQEFPASGTGREFRVSLADLGPNAPQEGDSLRIQGTGTVTDAVGNHAHAANRPVALGLKTVPRPPFLSMRMDRPLQNVQNTPQSIDFLVLSVNPDSSWTPVQGGKTHGRATPCASVACGGPVQGDLSGSIGRPAFTLETDRGVKYSVTIFNNLGEFLNGFSGEITNAQLGLDARNNTLPGAQTEFRRGAGGRFPVKIAWNARAHNGIRAGTGAYLAKITAISQAEDGDGKAFSLSESRVIRFGLMRN